MSKSTKVSLSTEVQPPAAAPAPAATAPAATTPAARIDRPEFITITEISPVAWAVVAVHIRDGYIICQSSLPEVFGFTGHSTITLQLGDPDQVAVAAAEANMAHAIELQRVTQARGDEQAAKQLAEAKEREAQRLSVEAEIEETKKLLRRLAYKAATL